MTFFVGQKVEFVGVGNFPRVERRLQVPRRSVPYTVRSCAPDPFSPRYMRLLVNEIVNPLEPCGYEMGWLADEFRPLVEKKTDISIFEKLLLPTKQDA